MPPPFIPRSNILKGIGASPGVAIGEAYVIGSQKRRLPYYNLENSSVAEMELRRLNDAFLQVEAYFKKAKNNLPEDLTEQKLVFEAHLMLLKDKLIRQQTENFISFDLINAEWALDKTLSSARIMFGNIEDEYIRSRLDDIELVIDSLLLQMMGEKVKADFNFAPNTIIVTYDFSPASLVQLPLNNCIGLVTETGSRISHTSIFAQALNLPAVVGIEDCVKSFHTGDPIIIDGSSGHVIVRADENAVKFYTSRQKTLSHFKVEIVRCAFLPAETLDEHRISVLGNLELVEEVVTLIDHGGEGVGLYRTEYAYMAQKNLPTEEELFNNYRLVVSSMDPRPVTIRTLDVGSDKIIPGTKDEYNPALGLRGIRFSLKYKTLFKVQLRAILRASVYGKVSIMAPMVSSIEEWWEFKKILAEVKEELKEEGLPFKSKLPVGIMIEVPAAVLMADFLAKEADFFSVGTNDLIQYTLAIDRINPDVVNLYKPFHPSVLRQLKHLVDVSKKANIPLAVCGDMAAEISTAAILVGLGIKELSMPAQSIPKIKRMIRMSFFEQLKSLAMDVLLNKTAQETQNMMDSFLKDSFPDLFQLDYTNNFNDEVVKLDE